jgi:hypothetical protein
MKERFGTPRWHQNLRKGEKRFRSAHLQRRKASPIGDPARRYHGEFDSVHYLGNERKSSDERLGRRAKKGPAVATPFETGRHNELEACLLQCGGFFGRGCGADCLDLLSAAFVEYLSGRNSEDEA